MPTIQGTIPTVRQGQASTAVVRFESLDEVTKGVRLVAASTLADTGVDLPAGKWLVNWMTGPKPARLVIDVPSGSGTHDLFALGGVEIEPTSLPIYWGTGLDETLTAVQVQALANSAVQTAPEGTYECAAGGYKYLAFPAAWGMPASITDAVTGFAVSLAGPGEDYSDTSGGFTYLNLIVDGVVYRVFRTRQILGGVFTWSLA